MFIVLQHNAFFSFHKSVFKYKLAKSINVSDSEFFFIHLNSFIRNFTFLYHLYRFLGNNMYIGYSNWLFNVTTNMMHYWEREQSINEKKKQNLFTCQWDILTMASVPKKFEQICYIVFFSILNYGFTKKDNEVILDLI